MKDSSQLPSVQYNRVSLYSATEHAYKNKKQREGRVETTRVKVIIWVNAS
jgi:hypothetical protein